MYSLMVIILTSTSGRSPLMNVVSSHPMMLFKIITNMIFIITQIGMISDSFVIFIFKIELKKLKLIEVMSTLKM